jgi:filamentous hemagglutinin family protein
MDRRLLIGTALSAGAALSFALPAQAQPAPNARPAGGSVVAGAATFAQSPTVTTVDQSTQRAAINWQSFNVGSQQTVQFQQPSASAVVLNRVVGPNPSQIAGQIDANGQVVITNQSGVMFYKGSQVNTAGLMVSAAGISTANFMAGRMVFDKAPHPNASITNQGSITVRDAGLAALVAPAVANSGVISARLGTVILAGARTATLDLYGDGLMAIDVTGQVVRAPNGATALVTNTGVIRADGGTVRLTARAADGVVQTLVDAGGKIQADTVGNRTGSVVLNGVGGSITVAGQLTATGTAPGTTGGTVEINPSGGVTLAQTARIDASGQAGGGVVAIGTTLARAKGGPSVTAKHTAANVTIVAGATIAANATRNGNGGHVTVLSAGTTTMDGTISAMGGPQGGNGGFVETSGPTLSIGNGATVRAGARSPSGKAGTWLLDPLDLDVVNGTATSDNNVTQGGNPYTVTPSGANATISNGTIENELGTLDTDVILTTENTSGAATGNITVDAGATITWNTAATLTMTAANNIAINATITGTNGSLTLSAGNATATPTGSITISAPISVNALAATAGTTGTINLNDGTGTVVTTSGGGQTYGSPVVLQATSTLSDTGGGVIAFDAVDATTAGSQGLTVNAGAAGGVAFDGAVGGSQALASLTVTGPTALTGNVTTTGAQTYNGAVTLDAITLTLTTTNATVGFESTVDSPPVSPVRESIVASLTVDAPAVFSGAVGGTTPLASLTANGPTTLDANVSTDGPQTYNSTVTLNAATPGTITLNSNSNNTTNGPIAFAGAITGGADSLVLQSGTGNQTLSGITTSGNLALTTTGVVTLNGGTYTISGGANPYVFPAVTTNGTLTLGQATTFGAVKLGSNTTIDSTNTAIDFASTVDATTAGGQGLTVGAGTGAVTFANTVGGTPTSNTALASLAVTGPTTLEGNVSTDGPQAYNSAVTLNAPTTGAITLNSNFNNTANGTIVFAGAITGGTNSLTLTSGSGDQTLSGITTNGNLTLTTTGVVMLDGGTYTIAGGTDPYVFPAVTTNGTLILGQATTFGTVTLGSTTTIDSTGTAIDFASTVDATAASGQGLTVGAGAGTVTFAGPVGGGQALANLAVTGPTDLEGNVTTTGAQTYNSPVTLSATVTLATTNAAVDFADTVNAARPDDAGLTVNAGTGVVTFGGAVGGNDELADLTVTGPTRLNGNVTTFGAQTYNSAVKLGATDTLTNTFGPIDFAGTVDAATADQEGLIVNAGTAAVTFGGAVGGTAALASLNVTGNTIALEGNVTVGAGGGITLQAPFGITTDNIQINAGSFITIEANSPVTVGSSDNLVMLTQTGNILISTGSPITAGNGGNLTLQAGLTPGSGGTLTLDSNLATDEGGEVGRITLQADGGIALNATDLTTGTLDISNITGGGVSQTNGGQIFVTTLQSTNGIAGNAGLSSTIDSVLNLGPFTVTGGTLTLNDENGLTINGPVAADFLNITAVARITLAGDIATLGAPLEQQSGATPAPAGSTLTVTTEDTNFGAFAQFVQTGTSMLTDAPGTTLRIQLPAAGGTATFANLVGPGANLVLGLGSGTATGAMQIGGLLVLGSGGSATLTGSVAGVTTAAAAALGQITPAVNPAYTFNGCEIGSAACAPTVVIPPPVITTIPPVVIPPPVTQPVVSFNDELGITSVLGGLSLILPSQALPPLLPLPPLGLIVLPTPPLLAGQLAPQDVVPPNISFEDY